MTKMYQQTFAGIVAAWSIVGIAACSDMQPEPVINDGENVVLNFSRSSDETAAPGIDDVDVYIFRGATLVKELHSDNPKAEPVKIKNVGDGMIYTTSGLPLDVVTGKTTVDDMGSMLAHCAEGADSAPLFYSGYAELDGEVYAAGSLTVETVRSVARIDLVNEADPNITVNEITVDDAPASAFVFAGEHAAACGSVSFTRSFSDPFKGRAEGVFTLFESDEPVSIRIRGFYGDIPMDMSTSLPKVQRNKVYTLQVVNAGSKIETTFNVKDWEEGPSVGAGPDMGNGLTIDPEYSVIPEGVKVDYEHNIVTVPVSGVAGMKLAFKGDTRIDLSSVDGLVPTARVSENPLLTVGDGYVSSVSIDVDPQGKGRLGYSMMLHLRNALMSQSYDYVEVRVDQSPYQIETVKIGGHEWMCFNATSQNLDEQIYILDGIDSVEDMYNQQFAETVGNYFQYGRPDGYSPWTSNDPNAVARPSDSSPWTNPAYVPLPEGYHIATLQEWQDLLPSGTTLPAEYTCRAGERIRATLVTLPGNLVTPVAAINNKKYRMRYVQFESLDTGNKLFIPICSAKTASTSVLPSYDFHSISIYWLAEDRTCWLMDLRSFSAGDQVTCKSDKFNYNGFLSVRGIKNAE